MEYADISLLGGREENQDRVAAATAEHASLLVVVDGMGHDLPEPVWRPIVEALTENFALAD